MKFTQTLKLFAAITLLIIATGCASVTRGTMDTLEVNSTPDQADIKIYRTNAGLTSKEIKKNTIADPDNPGGGPILGTTPGSFELARKGEYRVVISKEGYKTTEVEIGNRISGAGGAGMAGNLLIGGVVGAVIDSSSGAMKDLTPNPVVVTLEAGEGTISVPLNKSDEQQTATDEAKTTVEDETVVETVKDEPTAPTEMSEPALMPDIKTNDESTKDSDSTEVGQTATDEAALEAVKVQPTSPIEVPDPTLTPDIETDSESIKTLDSAGSEQE